MIISFSHSVFEKLPQFYQSSYFFKYIRFAAELLMPADEFIAEYVKVMKSVEFDERFAIPTLAAYFEVKENSVRQRLAETGL